MKIFILIFLITFSISAKKHSRVLRKLQEETRRPNSDFLPSDLKAKNAIEFKQDPLTRQMVIVSNSVKKETEQKPRRTYSLDIQDLLRIEDYLRNLKQQIISKVFGNIDVAKNETQLDKAYLFYRNLRQIRNNYNREKEKIEEKTEYLKKITEYSLNFIQGATNVQLSTVITERNVDIDSYNKFILLQLVEKLDSEMGEFQRAILEDFHAIFEEYDANNIDSKGSTFDLVNTNIGIAFKLTIFEQTNLIERIDLMSQICRKIEDNEDYHHLSKRSNSKITFYDSIFKQFLVTLLVSFLI